MNQFKKLFRLKEQTQSNSQSDSSRDSIPQTPEKKFALLNPDERMRVIMSLGDTGQIKYYSLLKHCIQSDPDIDIKFAALKRIHLFKEHPDLTSFLIMLEASENRQELEPYLSMALSRIGIISIEEFQRRMKDSKLSKKSSESQCYQSFLILLVRRTSLSSNFLIPDLKNIINY